MHNTLLFFIVCFYCLCSVDILVWGAQAGSQTPKRYLFEDIHRAITLATDAHESSQKRFLLTYSFFFFCSVFVLICMFRLQTLSIKLQLQSFNYDFFYPFLLSSSLWFIICWWMDRLLTIWQSMLLHQKCTNLCWNFTDLWRKKKISVSSEDMPIHNCTWTAA